MEENIMESVRSTGGSLSYFIRNIIGTYTPSDPTSMSGADWEYIISGLILIVCIYFLLKFITLVFKW